jgi:hypothetical protein
MPAPLKCPQCGASEANLLQDNIYQCKFCGSIYEYGDVKPVFETTTHTQKPITYNTEQTGEAARKIVRSVFIVFAIGIIGIAASVFFSVKSKISSVTSSSTASKPLYKNPNESFSSFAVVKTDKGPKVWTVSRRNSDGLKTVDYFLNVVDVKKNEIIESLQIGNTITWEQSLKDGFRMNQLKPMGKICWLIYGEKLLGYDVNTAVEVVNNETLKRQFPELKKGLAKVEDIYDAEGFKLTTKDGYTFYYLVASNSIMTEKEYEDKNKVTTDLIDKTEYCFTDGERQQLYKISRKSNKIFDTKISANTLNGIVKEDGDWYRRVYKINSAEEFTPGKVYFNASVLFYDDKKIVLIYQDELGESSPVVLKCFDVNKKEVWSKTGEETLLFKPFLKSTNSDSFLQENLLTLIQPYQLAVCLNIENGDINWSFKPY